MRARSGNCNGPNAVRGADRVRMSGEGNPRSYRRFDGRFHVLVGKVLQDLRDDKHWSLTQAGVAGGLYPTNLIKHERGRRPLALACLRSYLEAYGVSWELFGEKMHRLDPIRPSDIGSSHLNRLRREREVKGLNIFTGRPAITRRSNQRSVPVNDHPANPGVATLHVWCRRSLRQAHAKRWPSPTHPTRSAA
jgi:hypothetical protein